MTSLASEHARASRLDESFGRAARALVRLLTFAIVGLLFTVSPMLLFDLGINYGDAGGSFLEKVHPGTWLAMVTLLLIGVGRGNPLFIFDDLLRAHAVVFYLLAWAVLLIFTIQFRRAPFTPWIDTFLLPVLLYVLLNGLCERDKSRLAIVIHLALTANALLGLYEFLTGYRFTTYVAGEFIIDADWRATALLGHPLANALITGCYILVIGLGGARDVPSLARAAMLGLQIVALVAFGGRSSLVVSLALLGGVGLVRGARIGGGARFDPIQLALVFMALPILLVVVVQAATSGFFDPLVQRFVDDNGSANSRIIMLKLFNYIPWPDIFFGPEPALIGSLQRTEGIEYGLESFWIAFILMNGVFVSVIFFAGMAAFSWRLVETTRPATIVLFVYFYFLASTSVSMSAKTCAFGMFVAMVLTMMRSDVRPDARARR